MFKFFGKKLFVFLLLLIGINIDAKAQNAVKMIEPDGKEMIFMLTDHPVITFEDNNIILKTDKETISLEKLPNLKFEFVDNEMNSVEGVDVKTPVFKITQTCIEALNMPAAEVINILDLSGHILVKSKSDPSGYVYLDTSGLSNGVYIVSSNVQSFKYYKK